MSNAVVQGVKIHYRVAGTGDPVLLWHGFQGTSYSWRKVIPILEERWMVIAPDMRGYGDSGKPASGYDAMSLAEDFRALVRTMSIERLHVIAHDMGAPPALLWAAKYPGEIATLTYVEEPVLTSESLGELITFTPEASRKGGLWWWPFALAIDMPERLIAGKEREFLTWFYETYSATPGAIGREDVAEYLRTFHGTEAVAGALGVYRAIWESVRQTEPLTGARVETPTLAIGGEASLASRTAKMLGTVAANVTPLVLKGCGHFVPEEQPRALCDAWTSFVNEAGPSASFSRGGR